MIKKQFMPQTRPLRVGFDLDGVLLYNPARVFRPVTIQLKKILKNKSAKDETVKFYYPKSSLEKLIWKIVHWSSLFPVDGIEEIKKLAKDHKAEVFIVTSRYDCLKEDFQNWLKKMDIREYLVDAYHNKYDIQPHKFKEQKIKELDLDYFVEDNWDIVQHINKNTNTKTLWISNLLDKHIDYELKFFSLADAITFIKKKADKRMYEQTT